MALPEDILDEIRDLKRRVNNLERNPQPPNISLSDTATASFSLPPFPNPGFIVLLTTTIDNTDDKRLLAVPNQSIYKDSVSAANLWPFGSNWSNQDRVDVLVTTWIDWGTTDNNNVVVRTMLQNWGSSTFNLIFKVNHRFLLMESTLT